MSDFKRTTKQLKIVPLQPGVFSSVKMGNANSHERRKSGVMETGMTIENNREKSLGEEAALVIAKSEKQSEETLGPCFEAQASVTSDKGDEVDMEVGQFLKKIPTVYNFDEWTNGKNLPTVVNQHGSKNKIQIGPKLFKFNKINRWTKRMSPRKYKVISIQQEEDIETFGFLYMDSKDTNVRHQGGVETEFGQEIPGLDTFESSKVPPLPPHLRQGFLNLHKDTPLSCEPTSLPEPDHVMIDHLYAGPIKDGVLVFSSTRRFRNKFATSIHYKPIEP